MGVNSSLQAKPQLMRHHSPRQGLAYTATKLKSLGGNTVANLAVSVMWLSCSISDLLMVWFSTSSSLFLRDLILLQCCSGGRFVRSQAQVFPGVYLLVHFRETHHGLAARVSLS